MEQTIFDIVGALIYLGSMAYIIIDIKRYIEQEVEDEQ